MEKMESALVILCGGNSTRMGTDKALLPFGDCCLIQYMVEKFKPYFSKIYLSVKIKGDYAHLNLPVTEIPDIYPNAGPMSGVFSCLSMIDEPNAFFMSVDTPFLEPQTAVTILESLGDADICTLRQEDLQPDNHANRESFVISTAAYSKSCTIPVGKCLLLRQFTFDALQEKCSTKYLTPEELGEQKIPLERQFFDLDTRQDYYQALKYYFMLSESL